MVQAQKSRTTDPAPKVGVGFIVIRDNTHVLLHKRLGSYLPGFWGSGGGKLEFGESLLDGVMREFREEAGDNMLVSEPRFLGVYETREFMPETHYVDISYALTYISGEPRNPEPEKHSDWQWFPLDNLPTPLLPVVKFHLDELAEQAEV